MNILNACEAFSWAHLRYESFLYKLLHIQIAYVRPTLMSSHLLCLQSWYAVINLHGGPDSQITRVPSDASSYAHRDSLWVMQHYGYANSHLPPLLDSTKAAVKSITQAIRNAYPEVSLGAEANYHDPDMEREVAQCLHHGEATVSRLEALKREVDPDEVFWNPQSIRPRQDK